MGFFLTAFLVGLVGIIVAFVLPQTRRHAVTYAAIAVGDLWVRFRRLQRWWKNRKNPAKTDTTEDDEAAGPDAIAVGLAAGLSPTRGSVVSPRSSTLGAAGKRESTMATSPKDIKKLAYVEKEGSAKIKYNKPWFSSAFIRLKNTSVEIYDEKDLTGSKLVKTFDFPGGKVVLSASDDKTAKIINAKSEPFYIRCASIAERDAWMAAINANLQALLNVEWSARMKELRLQAESNEKKKD